MKRCKVASHKVVCVCLIHWNNGTSGSHERRSTAWGGGSKLLQDVLTPVTCWGRPRGEQPPVCHKRYSDNWSEVELCAVRSVWPHYLNNIHHFLSSPPGAPLSLAFILWHYLRFHHTGILQNFINCSWKNLHFKEKKKKPKIWLNGFYISIHRVFKMDRSRSLSQV